MQMQRTATVFYTAKRFFFGVLLPALLVVAHAHTAAAQGTKSAVSYSGVDYVKDSYYSYSGVILSLQQDLSRSGFMVQGYFGYGSYDYDNPSVAGGNVDGDLVQLSGLIGYMLVRSGGSASIYVGVDYQNHDLDPADPSNDVSGSEVGFKVAGDIRHITDQVYFTLEGTYSTAYNSYWSRLRGGLNRGRFAFGPEVLVIGNESFDAQRIGGFAVARTHLLPNLPIEMTFSGGYQFLDSSGSGGAGSSGGGEGGYAAVNFSFVY